ncbi:MAG: AAA family ATPase [Planctomycetota bacterium]|nr:AAA family ATPase [Planctomycetota bacterium]
MITKLTIENFKSIKMLTMDCRRVNVFIGEPNTGKSNILEALGILSWCGSGAGYLSDFVRYRSLPNLFYDELLDEPVAIEAAGRPAVGIRIGFEKDAFFFRESGGRDAFAVLNHNGAATREGVQPSHAQPVRFYRFKEAGRFDGTEAEYLMPPDGRNLFSLVFASRRFREMMQEFFKPYGLTVVFRPQEKRFEVQKQADGVVVSYPYTLTADTLQRVIFYTMAIASNKESVLVFEEPESNAFPYYTKQLGERIALDDSNQYFIATHNPYLLRAIVEKGKREDVNVAVTYFRGYRTLVKCLAQEQLDELLDADPFFNLSAFLEEDAPA